MERLRGQFGFVVFLLFVGVMLLTVQFVRGLGGDFDFSNLWNNAFFVLAFVSLPPLLGILYTKKLFHWFIAVIIISSAFPIGILLADIESEKDKEIIDGQSYRDILEGEIILAGFPQLSTETVLARTYPSSRNRPVIREAHPGLAPGWRAGRGSDPSRWSPIRSGPAPVASTPPTSHRADGAPWPPKPRRQGPRC